jgi:hypothetical protein
MQVRVGDDRVAVHLPHFHTGPTWLQVDTDDHGYLRVRLLTDDQVTEWRQVWPVEDGDT